MNSWQSWFWLIGTGGLLLCFTDIWVNKAWRRALAIFSIVPLLGATIFTAFLPLPYWQIALMIFIELFLLFSAVRAIQFGRPYQADMTGKSSLELLALLAIAAFASVVAENSLLLVILIIAVTLSLILLGQLIYAKKKYQINGSNLDQSTQDNNLPTVSVCIPARNETSSLARCLRSVLSSDYPKLEILVLDDCSQDKTAHVIRSFAQHGVRFIQGSLPSSDWLGKNQACATLAQESSGDVVLFMSVDTRVEPNTITKLVTYMLEKDSSMLAVLPERHDHSLRVSVVFAPLRYFWQLATPAFISVPSATSLWLIKSTALKKIGGFSRFSNHISPEVHFANILAKKKKYSFLVSSHRLGVYYAKKWQSQIDTGVRLWYPSLANNPSRVVLASLGQYIFILVPYIVFIEALIWHQYSLEAVLAGVVIIIQFIVYGVYSYLAKSRGRLISTLLWPILAVQEIAITLTSYVQYEFGKVSWKGRNVCYPVLSVVLPASGFGKSKLKVEP